MESAAKMYLRRSSLCSPTEEGQAPSKAAVLSEAYSPFSADPRLCKSPSPCLYSPSPSTHHSVVVQRDQGHDIFQSVFQFSARRVMTEGKQTTCSIPSGFVSVCVCIIRSHSKGSDKHILVLYLYLYLFIYSRIETE